MADLQLSPAAYLELFHWRTAALAESFPRWATRSPVAVTWELAVERADARAHEEQGRDGALLQKRRLGWLGGLRDPAIGAAVVAYRAVRALLRRP